MKITLMILFLVFISCSSDDNSVSCLNIDVYDFDPTITSCEQMAEEYGCSCDWTINT